MSFNPIWFLVIGVIFYLGYDLLYRLGTTKALKDIHYSLEDIYACLRELLNEMKKK